MWLAERGKLTYLFQKKEKTISTLENMYSGKLLKTL